MSSKSIRFLAGDTLKAKAVRSIILTVCNFGGQNVIRLASNLILTRILFPEIFGLMALIQVVLAGLQLFSDIGLRDAIIQDKRGDDPNFLNTAWALSIGRGFLLWFATIILAAPVAEFYSAPQLAQLLPVAGFTSVLIGFGSTRILTADRNLAIGRLTIMTLSTNVFGVVLMILFAWWWESIWALVIGGLISAFATTILSHLILPGVPNRFFFDFKIARSIIGFGKYIFLATIAGFIITNADRAVLGRFVPLEALAVYHIGLMLASVPMQLAEMLATRIIFPLYSRIPPSETLENRQKINRTRRLLTLGLLFGATILALSGIALIEFMYDSRYEGAGPIVVLMALAVIPRVIMVSYFRLTTAAGHTGKFATITVSIALIQLAALLIGVQTLGMGGAVIAPAIAPLLFYPALIAFIRQYQGWDPLHDALALGYFVVLTVGVIWLHGDALLPLFSDGL